MKRFKDPIFMHCAFAISIWNDIPGQVGKSHINDIG